MSNIFPEYYDRVAERSFAPLTLDHLGRLAVIAADELDDRFRRNPQWAGYADRVLGVMLAQGGALHYLDGQTGVKDLDVFTFFADDPDHPFPRRWPRNTRDFGPSDLGRHPADTGYVGRRIDHMTRALPVPVGTDPIVAVQEYLSIARTSKTRELAAKAMVGISPPDIRGVQVWPRAS